MCLGNRKQAGTKVQRREKEPEKWQKSDRKGLVCQAEGARKPLKGFTQKGTG